MKPVVDIPYLAHIEDAYRALAIIERELGRWPSPPDLTARDQHIVGLVRDVRNVLSHVVILLADT